MATVATTAAASTETKRAAAAMPTAAMPAGVGEHSSCRTCGTRKHIRAHAAVTLRVNAEFKNTFFGAPRGAPKGRLQAAQKGIF